MGRVADIAIGLCGFLFIFGGYVQFNDPDPAAWVAIYWSAAACAFLTAFIRPPLLATAIVAAASGVWALALAPVVFGGGELTMMFPDQDKTGWLFVDAEEAREMGGLLFIFAVMCAALARGAARRKEESSEPDEGAEA